MFYTPDWVTVRIGAPGVMLGMTMMMMIVQNLGSLQLCLLHLQQQ